MFRPVSSSTLQQFIGWIRGAPADYIDPKKPAMSSGRFVEFPASLLISRSSSLSLCSCWHVCREVTRVESTGVVKVKINIVTRNMKQFGYSVPTAASVST